MRARARIVDGMSKKATSEAARILSSKGASKGGRATAAKLSKAQRRKNARKAARARWAKARAKHGVYTVIDVGGEFKPHRREGGSKP